MKLADRILDWIRPDSSKDLLGAYDELVGQFDTAFTDELHLRMRGVIATLDEDSPTWRSDQTAMREALASVLMAGCTIGMAVQHERLLQRGGYVPQEQIHVDGGAQGA